MKMTTEEAFVRESLSIARDEGRDEMSRATVAMAVEVIDALKARLKALDEAITAEMVHVSASEFTLDAIESALRTARGE